MESVALYKGSMLLYWIWMLGDSGGTGETNEPYL